MATRTGSWAIIPQPRLRNKEMELDVERVINFENSFPLKCIFQKSSTSKILITSPNSTFNCDPVSKCRNGWWAFPIQTTTHIFIHRTRIIMKLYDKNMGAKIYHNMTHANWRIRSTLIMGKWPCNLKSKAN